MSGSTSGTSLGACGTLGMSPRLIPPHSVGKPYTNSPPSSIVTLLFRIDKTSLGVSRIGVATPRDDCPYAKSNANTFGRARAYRVFLTSCVGINLGDITRGLRHPRDVPSVDPSTLGQKTLYELASLKYCYNALICSFDAYCTNKLSDY